MRNSTAEMPDGLSPELKEHVFLLLEDASEPDRIADQILQLGSNQCFFMAEEHNWDDGFEVPTLILQNPNCDLATALMLFWLADGYSFFFHPEMVASHPVQSAFLNPLFERLRSRDFRETNNHYEPGMNAVQEHKMKKMNIEPIFFGTPR